MEEQQNINQEPEVKQVKKKSLGMEIWEWTYSILLAVVIALLIKNFLFSTTIVKGESMLPTLQPNNMLVIDRLSQVRGIIPERGDVITVEAPEATSDEGIAQYSEVNGIFNKLVHSFTKTLYVKRVIGLPGDKVEIEGNELRINGELIKEDYINEPMKFSSYFIDDIEVPEGHVFVMGDNRNHSKDSRYFGVVPLEKIEGEAIFRFWPFNKFGGVK